MTIMMRESLYEWCKVVYAVVFASVWYVLYVHIENEMILQTIPNVCDGMKKAITHSIQFNPILFI